MGFKRNQRREQEAKRDATRTDSRVDRKETRTDHRVQVTTAKAELVRAKASRLKWLFLLLVVGMAAYAMISGGGFAGILQLFKIGGGA
tara:strand:+ start:508 stop:771 length:264 start_codon:yes stop_codon:yes gene_type:complete